MNITSQYFRDQYTVRDTNARILAVCTTRDLAFRWLKYEVTDGDYSLQGPDCDMTFYRICGVVYPSGGTRDGKIVPPKSREECVSVFKRG